MADDPLAKLAALQESARKRAEEKAARRAAQAESNRQKYPEVAELVDAFRNSGVSVKIKSISPLTDSSIPDLKWVYDRQPVKEPAFVSCSECRHFIPGTPGGIGRCRANAKPYRRPDRGIVPLYPFATRLCEEYAQRTADGNPAGNAPREREPRS